MNSGIAIDIYTDGGCRKNPGIGAWGFIAFTDGKKIGSGTQGYEMTTNNQMELTAILAAMRWLEANADKCKVTIYADSMYAINCITKWYDSWVRKGVLDEKKNVGLIKDIMELHDKHKRKYIFKWVKGHGTNEYNNMVDRLVNETMDEVEKKTK